MLIYEIKKQRKLKTELDEMRKANKKLEEDNMKIMNESKKIEIKEMREAHAKLNKTDDESNVKRRYRYC